MKKGALQFAAVGEAITGFALLLVPSIVGQLLLGEALVGVSVPVARVAGLALIGLGLACWPGPPTLGMVIYSGSITVYLSALGISGGATGSLLWAAVGLHLVLAVFLGFGIVRTRS
jgi:hypothetical protein